MATTIPVVPAQNLPRSLDKFRTGSVGVERSVIPGIGDYAFALLSERIVRFRDASRERGAGDTFSPRKINQTQAFFELYADLPFWERYARSMGFALENEPVYIFDDERLVGMLYQTPRSWGKPKEEHAKQWEDYDPWVQMRMRQAAFADPFVGGGGAPGHIGWRWDWLLEKGVEGHIKDLQMRLSEATDEKARQLYEGAIIIWECVLNWNDRHVEALQAKAKLASGEDKGRIEKLIEICTRVPRKPPRNFHEAAQFFHFQHLAVMFENPFGGNGPGRVDYFLWPYLKKDLAEGITTLDFAKELIDELWIRFHERLQNGDGWVEAVVPGGIHPVERAAGSFNNGRAARSYVDGSCSVNPLSYIMVESIIDLKQTHPVVYPRVCKECPSAFTDAMVKYLMEGENRAQIYNDDVCIPAIMNGGVKREDAAMYMAGGCMEISPQGMNCDLNFARTHNIAKVLELVLNGGVDLLSGEKRISHDRDLTDYADFEDLYKAFETELAREYDAMVNVLDVASECYAEYRPCYLLSSLMNDCLERGLEQQAGGARYHDYGFAPLAITSAADSLNGIKRAVFDQKFASAEEVLKALHANFEGYEVLRARLRKLPMFGVEAPEADAMTQRVLRSVCTLATARRTRFGGRLKPMVFNFVWTPGTSAELGARGDGSNAGETIGHGMTPISRAMKEGITAAINSSTSLPFGCVTGGATTMWDMDDQWINPDRMKVILTTFLMKGGMIFQGNTTSIEELEQAMRNPEKYPNLIVRVGGFSARFVTLGASLQRKIINRRRHSH